jgi:uncharacterized protein (TIGR03086 family)
MVGFDERIVDLYATASEEFARRLGDVGDWAAGTPCGDWDVRQLVNHVARGNLNYVALLEGVSAAEFLGFREVDALGEDPVGAYGRSVQKFVEAFRGRGALRKALDYPLGRIEGGQGVAIRTADTVIHTWDLARATNGDEQLKPELVGWVDENLEEIYAGLEGKDRFFGTSERVVASKQDGLLRRMGR